MYSHIMVLNFFINQMITKLDEWEEETLASQQTKRKLTNWFNIKIIPGADKFSKR